MIQSPGMKANELQIVTPTQEHVEQLTSFFDLLNSAGDKKFFHPHSLSRGAAIDICAYCGKDYYCLMTRNDEVVAYGMLRGWDEGYSTPSLGVAVSPRYRGIGAGRIMMDLLHLVARLRNCSQVMLKVHKVNHAALQLYRSMGYAFKERCEATLTGTIEL